MEESCEQITKSPEQIKMEIFEKIGSFVLEIEKLDNEKTIFINGLDKSKKNFGLNVSFKKYKNVDDRKDIDETYATVKRGFDLYDQRMAEIVTKFQGLIDEWERLDPEKSFKVLSAGEIIAISNWIKMATSAWLKVEPDIVLICETSALFPAIGIKECIRGLNLNNVPKFRRIDARGFAFDIYGKDVTGEPGGKMTYNKETGKVYIQKQKDREQYLSKNSLARLDLLRKSMNDSTKVLVYDESNKSNHLYCPSERKELVKYIGDLEVGGTFPYSENPERIEILEDTLGDKIVSKIVENGKLNMANKRLVENKNDLIRQNFKSQELLDGDTSSKAVNYAIYSGAKNVFLFRGEPYCFWENGKWNGLSFYRYFKKISDKQSIGPVHDDTRSEVKATLHDIKLCGEIATLMMGPEMESFRK